MSTAEFKRLEGNLRDATRLVTSINQIHDRLSRSQWDQSVFDPGTERECQRLAQLYDEAIKASEEEEKCATKAGKILASEFGLAAHTGGSSHQNKKARNFYDQPSSSTYAAPRPPPQMSMHKHKQQQSTDKPKRVYPEGTQVACKIVQFGMDPSWILASVMEYVASTRKYRIKDDDPSESFSPEYLAPWKNVVCLGEETDIIPSGEKVLAIYPDSTIFYQATVVKAPMDHDDDYTLYFDGDQQQVRMVNGHYVFAARE